MRSFTWNFSPFLLTLLALTATAGAAEPADLIGTIKAVDKEGKGHVDAAAAAAELCRGDAQAALQVLREMKDAHPVASNWLQGVFEAIADRSVSEGTLPAAELEQFVLDRSQDSRARRVAYEWLTRIDAEAEQRLIPTMLDDPSAPLRRDAVAWAIEKAQQANEREQQRALWQQALSGAVDEDQVKRIAAQLKDLGEPVDLNRHFGFVTEWHLIGPFDNREMKGFDVAYPPEQQIDLEAEYEGMKGTVRWEKFESDHQMGEFNIAELTEPHKGAVDYAYTEFVSEDEQPVEFRLATPNAWKLWLNGQLVFSREEYHRGMRFDQYIVRGTLQPGNNTLLLKVCQNEQEQDWAQKWAFQFRVCDPSGHAVHPAGQTGN